MSDSRLALAQHAGLLPDLGANTILFGPAEPDHLSGVEAGSVVSVQPSFRLRQLLESSGVPCVEDPPQDGTSAIVILPRAKADARHLIARAVTSVPNGWIVIDGQKTDGVDSLLKQVKANVPSVQSYSKAHGKTIWFAASNGAALTDWLQDPIRLESGWWTAPGVFSADSVDPASQMLVDALPKLQGSGADLGAGWGYLSAVALAQNPEITKLALVEDNRVALECAGRNVDDPRAVFHWHDALSWTPVQRLDWVIMNPPFHTGRKAAPDLGRAFILRAAEVLTPGGVLYMVANAHLPYDAALADSFKTAEIIAKTTRYKAWRAQARRSVLRSR